jgi:hypothetical protein
MASSNNNDEAETMFQITEHGDHTAADEARLFALAADRRLERSERIDTDTAHVLACIRGERKDVARDGTTAVLDMTREVACLVCEHDGLDELVRRIAVAQKTGDWLAVTDQARCMFDDCVQQIVESRLPYHLQGE